MKIIKRLAKQIENEVDGVIDYAQDALELKFSDPQTAEKYFKLANVENSHVAILHEMVVGKVEEARGKAKEPPPQWMLDKWDKQHKKIIKKMEKAKTFLSMYK